MKLESPVGMESESCHYPFECRARDFVLVGT